MKIGIAIKSLRKEMNVTQEELSIKTGLSQTSLSKIECGTNPSEKNLLKICDALGITPPLLYILATEVDDVPDSKRENFKHVFPVIKNLMFELLIDK